MPIDIGTRLGPYEVVSPLGSGGMGEVYRARDTRLGRDVALKVLPPELAEDGNRLRRFEQEARAVAALSHPNILAVFDVGGAGPTRYMVTELLEGETLRARLERGRLGPRRATELALQIAQGLAAAHRNGIVHRDLKPDNVFITDDGRVKILDFGLAKPEALDDPATGKALSALHTTPGTVIGTMGYMSPEQVRGEGVDSRSDIFSFGALFYEMLSGRRAFGGSAVPAETMAAILREDPPELDGSSIGQSVGVERVIRRCLEKNPEQRFQSASDLAFAIQALAGPSSSSGIVEQRPEKARRPLWRIALLAALPVAAVAGYLAHRPATPTQPSYAPLTFHSGYIRTARFGPDGQTVVFAALWEGKPMQVQTGRTDTRVSQPLGPAGADLLAVSSKAELAIALDRSFPAPWTPVGTLARMPMLGGAPRVVARNVIDADFAPDGGDLAVARLEGGRCRLEVPLGTVLYENAGYISDVRFAPDGRTIAFMDHPVFGDDRGTVSVVDRAGKVRALTDEWPTEQGLAWSGDGREVWFTAADDNEELALRAVDLGGRVRLILRSFHRLKLQDVSRRGQLLITTDDIESDIRAGTVGRGDGPNLASFKWAASRALSADGRWAAINEFQAGNLAAYQIYLRQTDGSPPVAVGLGAVLGLSPDGGAVLATEPGKKGDLSLIPAGLGESRKLPGGDLVFSEGQWFPSGPRVMLVANEPGKATRTYVLDTSGNAPPRAITDEGVIGTLVSADGGTILATASDGRFVIVPAAGGSSRPIDALSPDDAPVEWLEDGGVLVYKVGGSSAQVERVDLTTGKREPWLDLEPHDRAGVLSIPRLFFTRDGRRYLYEVRHVYSDLFAVTDLR